MRSFIFVLLFISVLSSEKVAITVSEVEKRFGVAFSKEERLSLFLHRMML